VTLTVGATVAIAVAPSAEAAPSRTVVCNRATVVAWSDGDTVRTSRGTVRLIGVDTPERGRNGYAAATANAKRLAPKGATVKLCDPASVQNKDRYNRLLRYVVTVKGVDVGASQITKGSRAYYDSRHGYAWHPKQKTYIALDKRFATYRNAYGAVSGSSGSGSTGGSTSSCTIKGNISSSGERIYHLPGQRYYSITVIDTSAGERWFCTETQAVNAGWRKSKI
jgi:micrococcal nuclease